MKQLLVWNPNGYFDEIRGFKVGRKYKDKFGDEVEIKNGNILEFREFVENKYPNRKKFELKEIDENHKTLNEYLVLNTGTGYFDVYTKGVFDNER